MSIPSAVNRKAKRPNTRVARTRPLQRPGGDFQAAVAPPTVGPSGCRPPVISRLCVLLRAHPQRTNRIRNYAETTSPDAMFIDAPVKENHLSVGISRLGNIASSCSIPGGGVVILCLDAYCDEFIRSVKRLSCGQFSR